MMGDRYNFHYDVDPVPAALHAVGLARAYDREGGSVTLLFQSIDNNLSVPDIEDMLLQKAR